MPNLPSREAQIAQLVLRGIMPSTAERAVDRAAANDWRIPPANEAAWDAEVTAADIERARMWWWYTPDVPQRLRRILDARVVGLAANYDASQPRDPAGTSTGGQWTKQDAAVVDVPIEEPFEGGYYSERERSISFTTEMAKPERQRLIDELAQGKDYNQYGASAHDVGQDLAMEQVRGQFKAAGAKELAEDLRDAYVQDEKSWMRTPEQAQKYAQEFPDAWAQTANDGGGRQDQLHVMAYEKALHKKGISTQGPGFAYARETLKNYPMDALESDAAYKSIYQRSQAWLRGHDIGPDDSVVLYRGMSLPKGEFPEVESTPIGETIRFKSNPLSSFSLRYDVAQGFTQGHVPGHYGVVVGVRVPAKAIFAHWATGMGCADEDEVIVLGDYLADAKLYKVKHYD
jgi:hypothetical protein